MEIRCSKRLQNETPEYGLFSKKCLICLDNKHNDLFVSNPNCNHNICNICFEKWITISAECPLCKKSLIPFNFNCNINLHIRVPFYSTNNSPYIISFITSLFYLIYLFKKYIINNILIFHYYDEEYNEFFEQIHPNFLAD